MSFLNFVPGAVANGVIWGIMAIGLYITYKILDVADLTVDGSFGTGGAVLAICVTSGMNVWLSMLLAFIAGCLCGLVTGIFHTRFGIPAILAGILTQLALYSVNLRILQGSNRPISVDKYNLILSLRNNTTAIIAAILFTVAVIALLYWFFGTEFGHCLRATGCNPNMARANGINTNVAKIVGITVSNGIVAMAGALLAQYNGFADINMGRGAIVIGLAAIIIGEVIFGHFFTNFALRLFASVIGGIIYYIVLNIIMQMGFFDANDLKLFSALVVAVALGIPYWKKELASKNKKKSDSAVAEKEAK
ncbi:MAG: ABC transporter permease [Clostridiales bacterium]|nr:ABC transporter permease [Clostridiales bacterium]